MTKDTNKENAQRVIRYIQENVEGLKELSFGCIIEISSGEQLRVLYTTSDRVGRALIEDQYGFESFDFYPDSEFEIIGHEVQLNHLLLAIPKFAMVNDNERLALVSLQENGGKFDYDLTKTVEENLKNNKSLTNYLINLFGL